MPTFKFPITEPLQALFARKSVALVHDDGVYLCGSKKGQAPLVIRPSNGNQGMDAGHGDDWVEALDSIPASQLPLGGEVRIKVTATQLELQVFGPKKPATPVQAASQAAVDKAFAKADKKPSPSAGTQMSAKAMTEAMEAVVEELSQPSWVGKPLDALTEEEKVARRRAMKAEASRRCRAKQKES